MEKKVCMSEKEHEKVVACIKENILAEETVVDMANIFKVLSEPSRLKIVLALMHGECCVYHLIEAIGLTQSGVSHQLRVLKDNKIVKSRRAGQSVFYSIADAHIMQIIEVALAHTACK